MFTPSHHYICLGLPVHDLSLGFSAAYQVTHNGRAIKKVIYFAPAGEPFFGPHNPFILRGFRQFHGGGTRELMTDDQVREFPTQPTNYPL